jgi:hypothetical protein
VVFCGQHEETGIVAIFGEGGYSRPGTILLQSGPEPGDDKLAILFRGLREAEDEMAAPTDAGYVGLSKSLGAKRSQCVAAGSIGLSVEVEGCDAERKCVTSGPRDFFLKTQVKVPVFEPPCRAVINR